MSARTSPHLINASKCAWVAAYLKSFESTAMMYGINVYQDMIAYVEAMAIVEFSLWWNKAAGFVEVDTRGEPIAR